MKTYAVQILCGRDKVKEYFDSAVAYGRCPQTIQSMEVIQLYGQLICYFDNLPSNWTDGVDWFTDWLSRSGIPQGEMEFYGPRPHGLDGYWPNLKIEARKTHHRPQRGPYPANGHETSGGRRARHERIW